METATFFGEQGGVTNVLLPLEPSGSVFVVFRKGTKAVASVAGVARNGKLLYATSSEAPPKVVVLKAAYGVPGDPARTRDVRTKVQQIVNAGEDRFEVARMAAGDDPAFGVVKTLVVDYMIGNHRGTSRGTDPETIVLSVVPPSERIADLHRDPGGHLSLDAWKPGHYEIRTSGRGRPGWSTSAWVPAAVEVNGPWEVAFPLHHGAPPATTMDPLASWSENSDPGVKHFSGTASYTRTLSVPSQMIGHNRRLLLDLGKVEVMARVTLNGTDMGVLWKPPFVVDITDVAKPGANALEVKVVNLWINRLIGDEQLPEDSQRNPNGTLKEWPQWVNDGKPSPVGRLTFTSWRLWKKGDALVPSGLLGPVRHLAAERVSVE